MTPGMAAHPSAAGDAVRVFVGATAEQSLAVRVLDFSIRRRASMPVRLVALDQAMAAAGLAVPAPSDPTLRARTPFSFQRFAIPELAGFSGRALYLDSDMLVCADIASLWRVAMPAPVLVAQSRPWRLRQPQLSVMLLDCARLTWRVADLIHRLDAGQLDYRAIMSGAFLGADLHRSLPPAWNDLEHFRAGDTALLHYTDMSRQPWLDGSNPLAPLWCQSLIDAIDAGLIRIDEVADEVQRGRVRPSLLHQVEARVADPRALPQRLRRRDLEVFVPPHRRAGAGSARHGDSPQGAPRSGAIRAGLTLMLNDLGLPRARVALGHLLRRMARA